MDINQQLENYENFRGEYEQLKQQYSISRSLQDLVSRIRFLSENPDYHQFNHFLLFLGDSYIEGGDSEAGIVCMKAVVEFFPYIYHYTLFYLRMAQYHIEKGDTETGMDFLIRLCTEVTDYEVHIAANNLSEVWEKYKPLIVSKEPALFADKKTEPVVFIPHPQPKQPDECSQTIAQILSLPEADLLSGLSAHLGEMTANGAVLNCLNKWERVFYYADEMCMEVNSGGFERYLYYHGTHFIKACQVFAQIGAERMLRLTERIQRKFPRGRVPKSEGAIKNAMDRLDEDGIDFEIEDEIYYSSAEKELLDRLLTYVLENRKHFR